MKAPFLAVIFLLCFIPLAAAQEGDGADHTRSAPYISDPIDSDIPMVDLRGFSLRQEGDQVIYLLRFNDTAPAVSHKIKVCISTNRGLACVMKGQKILRMNKKNYPAQIMRYGKNMKITLDIKSMGYEFGSIVSAAGYTTWTTQSDPCVAVCADKTKRLFFTYEDPNTFDITGL